MSEYKAGGARNRPVRWFSVRLIPLVVFWGSLGSPLPAQADQPLALEEVIVTATRREASLQDVPVAVTAVPDWVLNDNQITRSEELTILVPSLTVQQGGNARGSSFNIRGVGTQSFSSAAEPSVSTMVDGVVMGRSGMAFSQLPDVQRVEVLRGPQGTLFGKNSSAGVVHIITKDPTPEHEGEVSVMGIEMGEYRYAGTAAGPITENWGYRITGSYISDRGYTWNVYDSKYYNDQEDFLVRGKLAWEPTPNLQLKYIGDWQKRRVNGALSVVREASEPTLSQLLPVVPSDENEEANTRLTNDSQNDANGHTLDINWDIGSLTLTSITAYRSWTIEGVGGTTLVPEPPTPVSQIGKTEQDQFTQELRLASGVDQFLSYVVGLYYFDQDISRTFTRDVFLGEELLTATSSFDVDTRNYAAFGELIFNLSASWRLIAGGRFTRDELAYKDFVRTGQIGGTGPAGPASDDTSENNFSGKLALQWDFSDSAMTYLSYTSGYKGPAYSIVFATEPDDLERVEPETSNAFEWGIKSRLFDNRMTFNVAAFYTLYDDWQAQAFIEDSSGTGTGSFEVSNAGKVSTRGIELDLTAVPVQNLTLYGALAYIRARIDEFDDGPCSPGQKAAGNPPSCLSPAEGGTATQDLAGGELPYSPDWRVTLSANYLLPLDSVPFGLAFMGTYRWQDDVLFSVTQDPGTVQDAYGVLDLALDLRDDDDRYVLTAFVKNVADTFYTTAIGGVAANQMPADGGYSQLYPKYARRTFGFEARYRWF